MFHYHLSILKINLNKFLIFKDTLGIDFMATSFFEFSFDFANLTNEKYFYFFFIYKYNLFQIPQNQEIL